MFLNVSRSGLKRSSRNTKGSSDRNVREETHVERDLEDVKKKQVAKGWDLVTECYLNNWTSILIRS